MLIMKDCKNMTRGINYTELCKELKRISKKYDITFKDITYMGFWDDGEYIVNGYGNITHRPKLELIK